MVLDTNVLIAYLDEEAAVIQGVQNWFSRNISLFISIVTYVEVLSLPNASAADLTKIKEFLEYFIVIDVDKTLAEDVASIRRKYRVKFADAAVAATAVHTRTTLVTRDKQFHKINEIRVISI